MGPIVTAATAAALPRDAILVHVEAGDVAAAAEAFASGHLPGARLVMRDRVTARPMEPGDGRHPLPTPEVFAAELGAVGIGPDDAIVAYDREGGASAARLVYLLRILGQDAALFDGGLDGWDEPLEVGPPPHVTPVSVPVRPWPTDRLVEADDVAGHIREGGLVLDARSAERYAGVTEPLDPVAGHVPGAVNAPFENNLDRLGLFRAPPKLHDTYAPLGAGPDTIVYCGSGVTACHDLLAIEHAGLGLPRLYVGSWSQWCRDAERPVATGDG
ncbi:sulfurtransferase [Euzebya rosea]|uniref:sulfurtransferase n=1 Tax=Euzebya rosea TaxID=2052804 RepID=UPI000D3EDBCC|nr:rhodanese-like domain-containing protein [Euzebya rosea]